MNLAFPINTAWMLACRSSWRRFQQSCCHVADGQSSLLSDIVRANQNCEFAERHDFAHIRDTDDFRSRVPLTNGKLSQPWIDRMAAGELRVLTAESIRVLEPTSGSTGGRRLVPYTDSLRRQFQSGIHAWIANLFQQRPAIRRGTAFWSVTPAMEPEWTAGGLKIGFEDDTQYLGRIGRLAANRVMAVDYRKLRDAAPHEAMQATLLQLLAAPDLALVSIWSPTFLLTLIERLQADGERLLQILSATVPRRRYTQIADLLRSRQTIQQKLARMWPRLAVISCWADASSAAPAAGLQRLFRGVELQPKGLISTEAFVSFPIVGQTGSALSLRSHFFEFLPIEETQDRTLLAHQLAVGQRYRVVVTTGGGLYRFQTEDVIEVVGTFQHCPTIRFCGRGSCVSDMVGEKLAEAFVFDAITRALQTANQEGTAAMLVPLRRGVPRYCLLLEYPSRPVDPAALSSVIDLLEANLTENPYYRHALASGQLRSLQARIFQQTESRWWEIYETQCLEAGMRRGDIKPTSLETRFDWDSLL